MYTNTKLSPSRLKEIRSRLNAATEGPWKIRAAFSFREISVVSETTCKLISYVPAPDDCTQELRNAQFISHSWEDMTLLIEEVERLQCKPSEEKSEPTK